MSQNQLLSPDLKKGLLRHLSLNFFVDNISYCVFWKDKDSVYIGCNDNFAESAGLANKDQIFGKTDYDLPWSKEESEFFRKIDREVMDSGQPQLNFEERQTQTNNDVRWLKTSKAPLFDDNGEVIGIIGWYLDITSFKLMQFQIDRDAKSLIEHHFELQATNKKLELANLDLEKFTYAASHDLKSPIRNMMNFAQLLKRNKKDQLDSEALEYVDYIISSARRMDALVRNILTYAKTGLECVKPVQASLIKIIQSKILDLQESIKEKAVDIQCDLPDTKIICYPNLLGLVIYNLLNNAIKFNESELPKVDISCCETKDYWVFNIKDNGIGIDPDYIELAFQPFKRLVGKEYDGSGLGLSICKRVINIHKGEISIIPNPAGGTIFNFTVAKTLR